MYETNIGKYDQGGSIVVNGTVDDNMSEYRRNNRISFLWNLLIIAVVEPEYLLDELLSMSL